MIARDAHPSVIEARLAQAADSRETLEVILVLRGRVRRALRPGRWRVRLTKGGVLTFAADTVVAATPVPPSPRR
jgi:hypothetical protein